VSHRPAIGGLHAYTAAQLTSPPGPGIRYAYMLNFPAPPGIIPVLHYTARPADLATVHERYYQDVKVTDIVPNGLGFWVTGGGTPRQLAAGFGSTEVVNVLRMPGRQIQYLSARPSMIWRTFDWPYFPLFFGSGQDGGWRLYHRGEQVTGNWNRYLLHPPRT
jgi:hypothetical protein